MAARGRTRRLRSASARVAAGLGLAVMLALPTPAQAQTGVVSGRVTNAVTGAAVTSGRVRVCATATCVSATLDATGNYSVVVAAGSYVLFTEATGLVNQIADGINCPIQCDQSDANALGVHFTVTPGGTVKRNFALAPEGVITGLVTDAATRAPVTGLDIKIATRFNGSVRRAVAVTDAAGVFVVRGLGPGTYAAMIGDPTRPRYVPEYFGDIPCLGSCSPSLALEASTPVVVTAGAVTSGIDFALEPGATITGTVRRKGTGVAQVGVRVSAWVRVGSEPNQVASTFTNAAGFYSLSGFPAGSYTVSAASSTLVDEVYDGVVCPADCDLEQVAAGRPVAVPARGVTSGIDFNLSGGGAITGRLSEAGTGTPLAGSVQVFLLGGTDILGVASASANATGVYTVSGLSPGSYVVFARSTGHTGELFGGVQIVAATNTNVQAGTRVAVTEGGTAASIDIVLDRGATIRGQLRHTGSLTPLSSVQVGLYQGGASPEVLTTATTDSTGNYALKDFPAGSYFVATLAPQLDNQAFNGIACPGGVCTAPFVASGAAPIAVANGATVTGIDFLLGDATGPPGRPQQFTHRNVSGGVEFRWSPPFDGGLPVSYVLEAGLTPGTTFASAPVNGTSVVIPGIPPGIYFLRVRGVNAGGAGQPTRDLEVRVAGGGIAAPDAPENPQPMVTDGTLTLTWFAPELGPRPTSYQLEVGTAAGRSDIGVVPVAGQVFQFAGVPPGVYFVRVRALAGSAVGPPTNDVTLVVGNVPAPPSEPSFLSGSVTGNVVTLRWGVPYFGAVTDYIIEAGSRPGATDLGVVRTGNTATTLSVPGVPPGRYYVRVRAVNARGVSPQSSETELVVP